MMTDMIMYSNCPPSIVFLTLYYFQLGAVLIPQRCLASGCLWRSMGQPTKDRLRSKSCLRYASLLSKDRFADIIKLLSQTVFFCQSIRPILQWHICPCNRLVFLCAWASSSSVRYHPPDEFFVVHQCDMLNEVINGKHLGGFGFGAEKFYSSSRMRIQFYIILLLFISYVTVPFFQEKMAWVGWPWTQPSPRGSATSRHSIAGC